MKTFQGVLERAKKRPVYEVGKEDVSRSGHDPVPARRVRARSTKSVSARELFERQRSRRAMICLFLAVLELVKLQALGLVQTGRLRRDRPEAAEGIRSGVRRRRDDQRAIDEGYHK